MNTMITSGSYDKHLEQQGAFSDIDPNELAVEVEKNWSSYAWECGDMIDEDKDEREEYVLMTAVSNGITYEGTGIYSCGELIEVQDIEIKH